MKKAFIYVGHSNWGKSFALRHVTDDNSYKKWAQINGIWFWVRKMSNDDQPQGLLKAVRAIAGEACDHYIFAYCPTHETDAVAIQILNALRSSCKLFFFIQESKYNDASKFITPDEIALLRRIGQVEILTGNSESRARANRFLRFIRQFI